MRPGQTKHVESPLLYGTPGGIETLADLALIQAVVRSEPRAWQIFVQRFSDIVYTQCTRVFSSTEVDSEHLGVFGALQANSFAILSTYDGRTAFKTFLHFKLREIFGQRVFKRFIEQPALAWSAFQRVIQQLLDPLKRRDEDLCQEICSASSRTTTVGYWGSTVVGVLPPMFERSLIIFL